MAKKRQPDIARLTPRFEDTEDGPGTGRLIFPRSVPCDHCGKPVFHQGNAGRGVLIVLEPEEGKPFWSGEHSSCARKAHEIEKRRGK